MKHYTKLVRPYLVWSILIIMVPLLLIILYSVTTGGNNLVNIKFTLDNFKKIGDPIYLDVMKKSFRLGFISVIICLVLGYIFAYFITRFKDSTQDILILLVTIPMWINTLLRTYAWISLLSDNGVINRFLGLFGLTAKSFMYTDFAVVIGLISDILPFMVIPIHTSIRKIDPSLIEAAYDLGADHILIQQVRIERSLDPVRARFGDRIDGTPRESALAHVVRCDRDGHLIEGVERDRRTATRQGRGA